MNIDIGKMLVGMIDLACDDFDQRWGDENSDPVPDYQVSNKLRESLSSYIYQFLDNVKKAGYIADEFFNGNQYDLGRNLYVSMLGGGDMPSHIEKCVPYCYGSLCLDDAGNLILE